MAGRRIKLFRRAKGLSKKDFAELLGVTPTTVYLWERGQRTPPYDRLCRIAEVLEVPRHVFFAEDLDDTQQEGEG